MARSSRRGGAVNSQMPAAKSVSTHGTDAIERYEKAPFANHPRDLGNGAIPQKIYERVKAKIPTTHSAGFSSPREEKGTPSHSRRRFSKGE